LECVGWYLLLLISCAHSVNLHTTCNCIYVLKSDTLLRNVIFDLIYLTRMHLLYKQNTKWSLCVMVPTILGKLHGMQIQEPHITLPMMLIIWLFRNPIMLVQTVCKSKMDKVCKSQKLGLPKFPLPLLPLFLIKFFLFLKYKRIYCLCTSFVLTITCILSFTHIIFLWRITRGMSFIEAIFMMDSINSPINPAFLKLFSCVRSYEWHRRLGHASALVVNQVLFTLPFPVEKNKTHNVCPKCQMKKSHDLLFKTSTFVSLNPWI